MKVSHIISQKINGNKNFGLTNERKLSNWGKYSHTSKRDESMFWVLALYIEKSKIKFATPTSGAERAAFWNGTGEYNTGTSTPERKVREDLKTTRRKCDIVITYAEKYGTNFWTTVQLNSTEVLLFKLQPWTYL